MNDRPYSPGERVKQPFVSALKWILSRPLLRRRIIFELQQDHYPELGVIVPLGEGLGCPVTSLEHWVSYRNIFCEKEYDSLLARIPLPSRWLDLGCHAGHFTLLLMLLHARSGNGAEASALLLDPDRRVGPAIEAMRRANSWSERQFPFLQGAIGGGAGMLSFKESSYMTSEIIPQDMAVAAAGSTRQVPCIDEAAIRQAMPPPYDLIKLDVEGGEYHFLRHYSGLLSQARHLLFEWHSWHPGGGGRAQLVEMAEAQGFECIAEDYSAREVPHGPENGTAGVVLFASRNFGNR